MNEAKLVLYFVICSASFVRGFVWAISADEARLKLCVPKSAQVVRARPNLSHVSLFPQRYREVRKFLSGLHS